MRQQARWAIGVGVVALLASLLILFLPRATQAQASPRANTGAAECVKLRIVENSGNGPTLYLLACGTGAAGESPVLDQVASLGPLVVDGGAISPAACTRAARCVVVWPLSPQEGSGER